MCFVCVYIMFILCDNLMKSSVVLSVSAPLNLYNAIVINAFHVSCLPACNVLSARCLLVCMYGYMPAHLLTYFTYLCVSLTSCHPACHHWLTDFTQRDSHQHHQGIMDLQLQQAIEQMDLCTASLRLDDPDPSDPASSAGGGGSEVREFTSDTSEEVTPRSSVEGPLMGVSIPTVEYAAPRPKARHSTTTSTTTRGSSSTSATTTTTPPHHHQHDSDTPLPPLLHTTNNNNSTPDNATSTTLTVNLCVISVYLLLLIPSPLYFFPLFFVSFFFWLLQCDPQDVTHHLIIVLISYSV